MHPHSQDLDSQNELGDVFPLLIMGIFEAVPFSRAQQRCSRSVVDKRTLSCPLSGL